MRWGRIGGGVALLTVIMVLAACGGGTGGKGTTSGVPLDLVTTDTNGVVASVAGTSTHASTHASTTSAKPSTSAASSTHGSSPNTSTTAHTTSAPRVVVVAACTHNPDTYTGSQHITVTPNTCLHDGQTVTVNASGFPAGHLVVVIECADKGDATGQADCDKTNFTHVDGSGSLTNYHLQVFVHLSGTNHIVCSASEPCLVSVSIPALTHAQEADRRITFA